jgi:glycosyltransferase involved in cell wall biosynthesis
VIILTLNEEANIADCLDSVAAFDDVHVLDSGSEDRTAAIAKSKGIAVHVNPFRGFGQQRNWAIAHIPTRYDWQFHLDADERMTEELAAELAAVVRAVSEHGGYHVPSKLMFVGRWLKRAGQYPGYQVRFFHKARLAFMDHGHGQREQSAHPIGYLKNPVIHHAFSKGIDAWFVKHVQYARREAEQALQAGAPGTNESLLSRDATARRRALKRLATRLPGRYFLRLGYMLFIRGAILDGWAGVTYAHMLATYEGMIEVYLRLLRRGVLS